MTSNDSIMYGGFASPIEGLGPGKRLVMWVRGCGRSCPGCMAYDLRQSANPIAVEEVADEMVMYLDAVDGITISGGEPFDQAHALCSLITILRSERNHEVLIYTGYLLEELVCMQEDHRQLLEMTDILIDGPFMQDQPNTLQWRGSDNQRVHLLSKRSQVYAAVKNNPMPVERHLQFQILGNDRIRLIGIPHRGDIERYHDLLVSRGIRRRSLDE